MSTEVPRPLPRPTPPPPYQPPVVPAGYELRKKKRKKWPWIVGALVILFIVIIAAAASSLSDDVGSTTVNNDGTTSSAGYNAAGDVAVTSCKADEYGFITAQIAITNHDDEVRSYLITAEAVRGATRVSEINAIANSVRAGQSVTVEGMGSSSGSSTPFTCRIVTINSFVNQ